MRNIKAISIAVAALMGLASASSFAQGYERRDNNDRRDGPRAEQRSDQRYEQRDQRYDNRDQRGDDRRDGDRHGRWDNNDNDRFQHYGARGPEWRRGGRIPSEYRNRQYVVNDWRGHHLNAPPRGYQWVQVGGDYVMVAIATGIIANLILNQ